MTRMYGWGIARVQTSFEYGFRAWIEAIDKPLSTSKNTLSHLDKDVISGLDTSLLCLLW